MCGVYANGTYEMSRQINYGVDPWCKADKTVLKKRRRVETTLNVVSYNPKHRGDWTASSSRLAEKSGRPSEARDVCGKKRKRQKLGSQ